MGNSALLIARRFGICRHSSTDSRKRGVRNLMELVAEERSDLIASFKGYALASTAEDLTRYQEWRRRMGLHHLVDAARSKRSQAMDDATGQATFG